jgi:hypothetical protein
LCVGALSRPRASRALYRIGGEFSAALDVQPGPARATSLGASALRAMDFLAFNGYIGRLAAIFNTGDTGTAPPTR